MAILITTCPASVLPMIRHHRPHCIISIVDPPPFGSGEMVQLPSDPDLVGALHLQFGDFHEKHFNLVREGGRLESWAMKDYHGYLLYNFLDKNWGNFETLIISCVAGVSRSASMALAIAEKVGVDKFAIEPCHRDWSHQPLNPHVYAMTKKHLKGFPS